MLSIFSVYVQLPPWGVISGKYPTLPPSGDYFREISNILAVKKNSGP
jgi:hypothetical protein